MAASLVWNLLLQATRSAVEARSHPLLVIVAAALFSSASFAQQDSAGTKSVYPGPEADSSSACFEDIYGRLPDATLSSLIYSYYEESLEISSRYDGLVDHFNSGEGGFMLGNREDYEVVGGLRNSWLDDRDQFYNVGFTLRPRNSWEFSGNAEYERYKDENATEHVSLGLSITHLSGGQVQFTEDRLRQYYFFSDLLLDPNQLAFSFSPAHRSQSVNGSTDAESHDIDLPVSLSYGLSDRLTAGVDGYFYRPYGEASYTFSNGISSLQGNEWEIESGLNLRYLFTDNNLFELGIEWFNNGEDNVYSDSLSGDESRQETTIRDKYSFAVLSASWNAVSLKRSISIYDLRKSLYTGVYLNQGETINQARVEYLTDDYSSVFEESSIGWTKKILLSDSLVAGALDFLQFELAGSLGVPLRAGDVWRGRLIGGFTFHNLTFGGTELDDFDYFFGKINSPGDYSATTNVVVSNMERTQYPGEPDLQFNLIGRFGIIRGLDLGLDFVYETWKYSGESSPYENWSWGGNIRGNILDRLRLQCSLSWGKDVDYAGGPWVDWNSVTAQLCLSALF